MRKYTWMFPLAWAKIILNSDTETVLGDILFFFLILLKNVLNFYKHKNYRQ